MGFFEPPPRTTASVARAVVSSPPAWLGPPHNVLPGIAPVELIIARTKETVVATAGIRAYPEGFGFTLSLRLRTVSAREEQHFPYLLDHRSFEGEALPDEFLRFGVQLPTVARPPTLTARPTTQMGKRRMDRCCSSTVEAVEARRGTWSTGCGRCHRPGRSPLSVRGRAEASRSRGPRSMPECFSTSPGAP